MRRTLEFSSSTTPLRLLAALLGCAVLPSQARAQPPPAASADFALVDVNPRLPYDFFAAPKNIHYNPEHTGQGWVSGSGVVLCYYDSAGRPKVAIFGLVAAPPSPEECHRLNGDRAGLPKPPAGWKPVAYLATSGGAFLDGSLGQQFAGRQPFDAPYVYTAANGSQQSFYIVIKYPKPQHEQFCSDGTCVDGVTDLDEANLGWVVSAGRTLVFLSGVMDNAMSKELLLLRRIPQQVVSFDHHIFLVPAALVPDLTFKTVHERLSLLAQCLQKPSIQAPRLAHPA